MRHVFGIGGPDVPDPAAGVTAPGPAVYQPAPPPPVAVLPGIDELWPMRAGVPLKALEGTPEWLDALADLPYEERASARVKFRVYRDDGEASFLDEWGTTVPTPKALQDKYSRGGRFLVRPLRFGGDGKGGRCVAEVAVRVEPRNGARADDGESWARSMLERMIDGKATAKDGGDKVVEFLQALVSSGAQLAAPHLPKLASLIDRLTSDEASDAAAAGGVVGTLKKAGLLDAASEWVRAMAAKANQAKE